MPAGLVSAGRTHDSSRDDCGTLIAIMKKINLIKIFFCCLILLTAVSFASAQKTTANKTIFAVLDDGKTLEPIAFINGGKLKEIGENIVKAENRPDFVVTHYKPRTKYNLIFGGADVGTVTVIKDLAKSDCAKNQANISVQSSQVNPKGFVMALATDAAAKKSVNGTRQLPTMTERSEIEKIVMADLQSQNVPIKNINALHYHNLTKLDVDSNGTYEFVGTYWYNSGDKKRSLLFFIAHKDIKNQVTLTYKDFKEIDQKDVLSGDIGDLDKGFYHELLIDIFDYDGDGASEIFTITPAFEGSNFNVYKRKDGIWTKAFETSNYHCAF